MPRISTDLAQQLESMPNRNVGLIVRTHGDASPHLDWLATEGFTVTQQYRLTPGVAVTCAGADALKLLDQDWVKSIELDAEIKAM